MWLTTDFSSAAAMPYLSGQGTLCLFGLPLPVCRSRYSRTTIVNRPIK